MFTTFISFKKKKIYEIKCVVNTKNWGVVNTSSGTDTLLGQLNIDTVVRSIWVTVFP